MKRVLVIILLILAGGILFICGRFVYFDMDVTYRGKVVDADTGEPIEGAVVVAYWMKERATIAGADTELKDVREVLTDEAGQWEIEGPRGVGSGFGVLNDIDSIVTFLTGVYITRKPEFIVYKPGYCSWPPVYDIEICREKAKGRGRWYHRAISEIIQLPRLTRREDRIRAHRIGPIYSYDEREKMFLEKQKEFIRLLKQEEKYLWPD